MGDKKLTEKEQKKINEELFDAVKSNDLSAVKSTIEAGALINSRNKYGESVLSYAIYYSHLEEKTAKLLLEYGADIYIKNKRNETAYVVSVLNKRQDITEFLMSHGYVPSKEDLQLIADRNLYTAVQHYYSDLIAIQEAVKAGADINAKNEYGESLLYQAVTGSIGLLKCLLKLGANPNIQKDDGNAPLHRVTYEGWFTKVKLLLKYKADMYIKDGEGRTPFDISLLCGCYDIAELFISNGYVPSDKGMQKVKNHRLLKAVKESDLSAVKTAIADGADVNAEDGKGNPLLLDANFNDTKVMRYLLENGMNPNMQNDNEWSLLHICASYQEGFIDSIKLLLKHGADMTVKNKWGDTPFRVALSRENHNIAELFVLNGYVPSYKDFNMIKDETEKKSLKVHFKSLATQVQEHKEKLTEETESQEFACANEVIDM